MSTYYADSSKDLKKKKLQIGELIVYTCISKSEKPLPLAASHGTKGECAYAFYWSGEHYKDAKLKIFHYDQATYFHIADCKSDYVFCFERGNNLLRQISGPDKPFALCNLGTAPLRVDTISGKKFLVSAGVLLRLGKQRHEEKRKKRIILLTLRNDKSFHLRAAHILEDGNWRRINLVEKSIPASILVTDDHARICRLEKTTGNGVTLYLPTEPNPDYDIYLTTADAEGVQAPSIDSHSYYDRVDVPTLNPYNVYSVSLLKNRLPEDCCKVCLPYDLPKCQAARTDR